MPYQTTLRVHAVDPIEEKVVGTVYHRVVDGNVTEVPADADGAPTNTVEVLAERVQFRHPTDNWTVDIVVDGDQVGFFTVGGEYTVTFDKA